MVRTNARNRNGNRGDSCALRHGSSHPRSPAGTAAGTAARTAARTTTGTAAGTTTGAAASTSAFSGWIISYVHHWVAEFRQFGHSGWGLDISRYWSDSRRLGSRTAILPSDAERHRGWPRY